MIFSRFTYDNFVLICETILVELRRKYAFGEIAYRSSGNIVYEASTVNKYSGIRILYDARELELQVAICILVNGEIVRGGSTKSCYYLYELLPIFAPGIRFPGKDISKERDIKTRIEHTLIYAIDLIEMYLSALLLGDFTLLNNAK